MTDTITPASTFTAACQSPTGCGMTARGITNPDKETQR